MRNDFGEALTGGKTAALALLFGFAVTLGLVLAPFALAGGLGDALFLPFGLGGGTVTRAFSALYLSTSGPGAALAQRLSGWPNQLLYYAPIWLAVLLAWRQRAGGHALLLGAAVALTIAHGVLPQRINHSYLTVAMPFWLAWLATCRITWPRGLKAVALAVVAVACAGAATKRGIDRLDRSGRRTVAAELRDIGDELARTVEPDEPIFTFAAECAVAADRDVWPGCEPGYFSLFPNLTAEEAASVHVLEDRAVLRLIARREPRWLLLHDSAFYPVEPTETEWPAPWQYWAELAGRYEPIQRWAAVGEKREPLTLYKRIPKGASAGSANRAQH